MCCDKAVGVAGLLAALLLAWSAAALDLAAGPEIVFAGGPGRCNGETMIPDAPARALRTAEGGVRMFASHFDNRSFSGPDLDHLVPDCRGSYRGAGSHEPADYDDHAWIAATYSPDGRTVHALLHDELHGHRRPDLCPAARYLACWANRITAAISRDGGRSFQRSGLVATPPYRYDGTLGRHVGYFNPSNIFEKDGWYYATVFATSWGAQRPGNCLLRTRDLGDPGSWRAWDGQAFTVSFVDPYRSSEPPEQHVCTPLPGLPLPVGSVVRHRGSGRYVATLSGKGGFYTSWSADLLNWSPPQHVWQVPVIGGQGCEAPWAAAYPALLDETAPERNFDSVGDTAWLYYTRLWAKDCRLTLRRDLMRVRVTVAPPP